VTIATDLLQRHIQTLVEDHVQWQTLIADDLVWELPYAPSLGHPARLSGGRRSVGGACRSPQALAATDLPQYKSGVYAQTV
jgi:hypothetical protein